jgi:hypothetical protein
MVIAVGASLLLLLAVVYVPFLQVAFNTVPLGWDAWQRMLPLILLPSVVAEIMKWLLRLREARRERAEVA